MVEDPAGASGSMMTTNMTLTGVSFMVEGIAPTAVVELMSSLDVERVSEAMLSAISDRLPEHRALVFMPAAEQRGPRTFGLDGGGELCDAPEGIPLRVLALLADAPRMLADLVPVGDGWLIPLRPSGDPLASADGREIAAVVYLPSEPEPVPESAARELVPLLAIGAAALRNAMRHEELLQREYRITLMHQLAQVLGAVRDSADLVKVILDRMIDIGRADRAFIMLRDEQGVLAFVSARSLDRTDLPGDEFQVSGSLIEDARTGGEIVHVHDEADLQTRHSIYGLALRSVTVVPLRSMVRALASTPDEAEAAQQTLLAVEPEQLGTFLRDTASSEAESIGVVYLESRRHGPGGEPDRTLLRLLADQAGFALDISRLQERLVEEAAEQERLKQRQAQLARYMSADVAEAVMARPELLHLGGARRQVTVMFTDVRGFTAWAQRHNPEQVVGALNRIFSVQTEVLFAHGGTLDKFLGDGLMALFGAPISTEDHAARAVAAATEMQRRLRSVLRELAEDDVDSLTGIGIGVHTGEAAVGNIGSETRMEYTAIGDAVNLASRLCDRAQAGQVLVSQATMEASEMSRGRFVVLETMMVKGRSEPVDVAEARVDP